MVESGLNDCGIGSLDGRRRLDELDGLASWHRTRLHAGDSTGYGLGMGAKTL